tara:strand:+ start:33 stop:767 length:735 start_codon:yes stop_codon:yes gene_type:complete
VIEEKDILTAKKVDVIIPVYNSKEYLEEALTSCVNQIFKDFTVYVIDDNSTENIKDVVDMFSKKLDIVYIKNPKNMGPAASRNVGIKKGSADFISFLDSDDIWTTQKLSLSIKEFRDNPQIGMTCGNYRVWSERKILNKNFYKFPVNVNFETLKKVNYVASGSVTVKRSVIEDVGLFNEDYKVAEDYDLWVRISKKYKIKYIHRVLYHYSWISDGNSLTKRSDLKKHAKEVRRKIRVDHYGDSS